MAEGQHSFLLLVGTVLGGFGPDDDPNGLADAAILVEDGKIAEIGPASDLTARHPDLPR